MDLTTNNTRLLHYLSALLLAQAEQALQEQLGIGLSQYRIMAALEEDPHIQQRQIATTLNQTEAAVSRQVKLLIKQGFIVSTINPKNRRAHITTLTTKGLRFSDTAHSIFIKTNETVLSKLDDKQQKTLEEFLDKLYKQARKANNPIDQKS
jgi:DNA-binding MarR family transcriptional regulator